MEGHYADTEEPLLAVSLATLGYAQISTNAPIDGRRFWNPMRSEHGKLNLGKWTGVVSWPAKSDTLYRQFTKGYIKFTPRIKNGGWPYGYVVVDTVSSDKPDTLLISNDWPRESVVVPPPVENNLVYAFVIDPIGEPKRVKESVRWITENLEEPDLVFSFGKRPGAIQALFNIIVTTIKYDGSIVNQVYVEDVLGGNDGISYKLMCITE